MSAYEQGSAWYDKGLFWLIPAVGGMIPVSVICPILQAEVTDNAWSVVILAVQLAFLAGQVAAGVRMGICYRRAIKFWRAS